MASQWISVGIAGIMMVVAIVGMVIAFRKGKEASAITAKNDTAEREKQLIKETEERAEVKNGLRTLGDKLDGMDRNISDKLSRIEGQYASMSGKVDDHEKRIFALEFDRKSKEE